MFPNAIIYCFEADESNIERIKNKIGNNNKIKINHYAISDIDGEVDFYPSKMIGKNEQIFGKGGGFAGSIKKQTEDHINGQKIFNLQDFSEEVIKVPSITIKKFCEDNNIKEIDFLHADVEGAVIEVLNGFGNIRPHFLRIEINEYLKVNFIDCKDFNYYDEIVKKMGYEFCGDYEDDALYEYIGTEKS